MQAADTTAQEIALSPRGFPPRLGRRVALTFTAVVLAACVVAAALLFSRAQNERQAIRDRASSTAVALSFGFDQEVAAVNYLLKGLSKSPALLSGDIEGFYWQMKATPVPEGSWLILQDLEGQVANTLRPFGDPTLPKHTAFPNYQEQIARIHDRGWSVSGRQFGIVKRAVIIALSLRIDGPDGQMRNWITTILSDARVDAILGDQSVPADWTKAVYDRSFQPIVTDRGGQRALETPRLRPCARASPAPARTARWTASSRMSTSAGSQFSLPIAARGRRTGRPPSPCGVGGRLRMGVGIPGMHARLRQFGGDLKIRTGSTGTSLLAYVPLPGSSNIAALRSPLRVAPRLTKARG